MFGCISSSVTSLMSRSVYPVLAERSFVSCSLIMWSWLVLCSATADLSGWACLFTQSSPYPVTLLPIGSGYFLAKHPNISQTWSYFIPTRLWGWNRHSVPKCRHIKFRRRGITQKKAYSIQNRAKVWNQEFCAFNTCNWCVERESLCLCPHFCGHHTTTNLSHSCTDTFQQFSPIPAPTHL